MNKTLANPYYLFSFQHIASKERISFIPQVITSNVRYDKFRFVEAPTTNLSTTPPQVYFQYLGQYYYSIYEQVSSGNTDPSLAYNKLESGRANVIVGNDNLIDCIFEPYISNDEDFGQVIYVAEDEEECIYPSPTPSITPTMTPTITPTCPSNTQFFMTGFLSGGNLEIYLEETLTNASYNSTCPFDFSLTLLRDDDATTAFTATFTSTTDNQSYDISAFLGSNDLKTIIYNSITLDSSCSCLSAKVYNYYRVNRCSDGAFVGSIFAESGGTYVNSVRNLIQNGDCMTISNTLRDQWGYPNGWEWSYSANTYTDCNDCLGPSPTPSITPTLTPTLTPTSTCPITTQYLEVQIFDTTKFKLILWNDAGFTSASNANCDYNISGCAYGDLGTVYCGIETITTGQHQHQFNLAPVLLPGEVVTGFTTSNYTLIGCPCPVNLILPP